MDVNKSLQVKKENVFTRFINFFKNLFKPKEKKTGYTEKDIILQKERVKNIITPVEKKEFIDGIKVPLKNEETLMLQQEFESDSNMVNDLSDAQIKNLIQLYKDQVSVLRDKINKKRIELEKTKKKIEEFKEVPKEVSAE